MTPEVRIIRITEQIAHLKVMLAVEEERLKLATIASYRKYRRTSRPGRSKFRIHDFEDELDELHAKIAPRKMPKPRSRL